jgi:ABC-type glycerol-3-phosphate transport system permease component
MRARLRTRPVEEGNPLAILRRRRRDAVLMQILLLVLALWWLFPLITVVRSSLQVGGFGNYATVLTKSINGVLLPRTFLNSLAIAVLHALLVCSAGSLAGYAFSRLRFPARESIYYFVLAFLAVPATAVIVPVYFITGKLGLFNSYIGVALPEAALTLPFAVLLMRNYADGISDSFFEAAAIDGAGQFRLYWSIFLPLARPTLINLATLCVMWSFQDFLFPSLLLNESNLTTAAQAVQTIRGAFAPTPQQTAQFFAALALLALPAVLLVVVGLRWMTHGLTAGGSKE